MITKRVTVVLILILILCPTSETTLIPPAFLDRVVAIGRKETNPVTNQTVWIAEASGFLYAQFISKIDEKKNEYALYLVTNRHVIEEHARHTNAPLSVKFNLTTPGSAREYDVSLQDANGKPAWHFHPNPSIDVGIFLVNEPFLESEGARFDYFRSESDTLERSRASELGLSEGDGVFVLGFPLGIVGEQQDYVIARRGTIARVRDFLESPAVSSFLIDSFIFPGNSGGPVVLCPEMVSITGSKPAINQVYLIGMVKGFLPYTDVAISTQTNRPRVTFEENSGLAEVVPIEYVRETIADRAKTASPAK